MNLKTKTKFLQSLIFVFSSLVLTAVIFYALPAKAASLDAATVISLTNVERTKAGVGSLSANSQLNTAAQIKANDILAKGYFAHVSPDGTTPWDIIRSTGYTYIYAGENLAIGYTDPYDLMAAWMASPTHRDNIVNTNFREIGVAVVAGQYNGAPTVVVAQEFGTPAPAAQGEVKATTNEVNPQPSSTPSPTPTPATLEIIRDKSSVSPANIFTGDGIDLVLTAKGDLTGAEITFSDERVNLLENGKFSQSGGENIYTYHLASVSEAGNFSVVAKISNKEGNSKTETIGSLNVSPAVVTNPASNDNETQVGGWKEKLSVENIFVVGLAGLIIAGVIYYFLRKIKLNRMVTLSLAMWDF